MCTEHVVHLLTKAIGQLDIDLSWAMDCNGEAVMQDAIMGSMGGKQTLVERVLEFSGGCWPIGEGNASIVLLQAAQNDTSSTSMPHPLNKCMSKLTCNCDTLFIFSISRTRPP